MIIDCLHTENTEENGGPQADCLGEQGLMNDDRLLITDGVHTENTDDTEVRKRTEEENGN